MRPAGRCQRRGQPCPVSAAAAAGVRDRPGQRGEDHSSTTARSARWRAGARAGAPRSSRASRVRRSRSGWASRAEVSSVAAVHGHDERRAEPGQRAERCVQPAAVAARRPRSGPTHRAARTPSGRPMRRACSIRTARPAAGRAPGRSGLRSGRRRGRGRGPPGRAPRRSASSRRARRPGCRLRRRCPGPRTPRAAPAAVSAMPQGRPPGGACGAGRARRRRCPRPDRRRGRSASAAAPAPTPVRGPAAVSAAARGSGCSAASSSARRPVERQPGQIAAQMEEEQQRHHAAEGAGDGRRDAAASAVSRTGPSPTADSPCAGPGARVRAGHGDGEVDRRGERDQTPQQPQQCRVGGCGPRPPRRTGCTAAGSRLPRRPPRPSAGAAGPGDGRRGLDGERARGPAFRARRCRDAPGSRAGRRPAYTVRSASAATSASWVASTTVISCERAAVVSVRSTWARSARCSGAVGSSAKSTAGVVTRARARATRCRCDCSSARGALARAAADVEPLQPLQGGGLGLAVRGPAQQQRQGRVLPGGQLGHQLGVRADPAEAVAPQPLAGQRTHGVHGDAVEPDLALLCDELARTDSAAGWSFRCRAGRSRRGSRPRARRGKHREGGRAAWAWCRERAQSTSLSGGATMAYTSVQIRWFRSPVRGNERKADRSLAP